MSPVCFIDTSVLCNLLPVPGRDQDREQIKGKFKEYKGSGTTFILPVTTIIETGNHIAHLPDGHQRRETAMKYTHMIDLMIKKKAPWQIHSYQWDSNFLTLLINGVENHPKLIDQAVSGVGCGDLCILAERYLYAKRTGLNDVTIWTLDQHLNSYSGWDRRSS